MSFNCDIFLNIIQFLNIKDIITCLYVNKEWNEFQRMDNFWQVLFYSNKYQLITGDLRSNYNECHECNECQEECRFRNRPESKINRPILESANINSGIGLNKTRIEENAYLTSLFLQKQSPLTILFDNEFYKKQIILQFFWKVIDSYKNELYYMEIQPNQYGVIIAEQDCYWKVLNLLDIYSSYFPNELHEDNRINNNEIDININQFCNCIQKHMVYNMIGRFRNESDNFIATEPVAFRNRPITTDYHCPFLISHQYLQFPDLLPYYKYTPDKYLILADSEIDGEYIAENNENYAEYLEEARDYNTADYLLYGRWVI
jgi:hypothetical protein